MYPCHVLDTEPYYGPSIGTEPYYGPSIGCPGHVLDTELYNTMINHYRAFGKDNGAMAV